MSPNDADGMANSADPDQTHLGAVEVSSLIWVYTVCPGISVRKLRTIAVNEKQNGCSAVIVTLRNLDFCETRAYLALGGIPYPCDTILCLKSPGRASNLDIISFRFSSQDI